MIYVLLIVAAQLKPIGVYDTLAECHAAADKLPQNTTAMCLAWVYR